MKGTAALIIAGLVILSAVALFVIPSIRLWIRRKKSRTHYPQPEELWVQGEDLLYIDAVTSTGVEIMCVQFNPNGGPPIVNKWKDSWPEWNRRLRTNIVFFTGERRPLGPVI